jgi:hypothetical protein
MTAPFTVTAARRRPVGFPTLDAARAYAQKLLARDVQSVITDSSGQIVGTYELFGRAS